MGHRRTAQQVSQGKLDDVNIDRVDIDDLVVDVKQVDLHSSAPQNNAGLGCANLLTQKVARACLVVVDDLVDVVAVVDLHPTLGSDRSCGTL